MDIDGANPPSRPAHDNKAPKKKEVARRAADAAANKTLPPGLLRKHILSYLLRNCHRQTALALLHAQVVADSAPPPSLTPAALAELDARRHMMDAVLSGDILAAITMANALLPSATPLSILYPMVHIRLLCQHFAELVRVKKTIDALSFAQQDIAPLGRQHPAGIPLLQTYLPLLAYREPERSPMFELVDVRRRDPLAEELNGCVYGFLREGETAASELERLLRHLTVVMRNVRDGAPDWSVGNMLKEALRDE